ncbi:LysR family transcriptional regulator [Microbulbifer sp. OS29]|uniref:LysR family transcriptional regulator n=1 Tax=Microbulbifer okhotskensis TaxID=2926617 RepID=A0A9X2EWP9_9GAMM|nr:LysR family transcriptional regulator [Microbulbifer okhotskensis]MCO1336753.1 LysR family transcriptional regulator [Microbulbifer okhotskensis]
MTQEQLKMFIAVVEQGSFRGAAKAIFKTQPTISNAIKKLEEEFGFPLFDRDSYRPGLTKQGESFYQQTKRVMQSLEQLSVMGHQLGAGIEPKFTVVISGIVELSPLLKQIKPIVLSFSNTDFSISTELLSGVMERVDDNEADLAFATLYGVESRHEWKKIGQVELVNVVAPGVFPAENVSQLEASQLPQIVVRDTGRSRKKGDISLLEVGRRWFVNDYHTKKQLTLAGLGWGRIPRHFITGELEKGLLIPINVEGIKALSSFDLCIIRNRGRSLGPIASRFWNFF